MKKTCIIFLALLLANIRFGFAQNTPEFAPVGAEWYFSYVIGSFYPDQGYAIERVKKDTVINGTAAKIIEFYLYSNQGFLIQASPTGNKSIWASDNEGLKLYHADIDVWKLQFKYKNKGDTFHLNYGGLIKLSTPEIYYIANIDTQIVNGYKLPVYEYYKYKRENDSLYLDTLSAPSRKYVKHIGGFNGLWFDRGFSGKIDSLLSSTEFILFRCYSDVNISFKVSQDIGWWKSTYPCDTTYLKHFIYNDVADHAQSKEEDIQVYPNPTRDIIRIKASEKILDIELYTISGDRRAAWHEQGSTISLEKLNLSSGIYILKIKTNENTRFKKVYKVH